MDSQNNKWKKVFLDLMLILRVILKLISRRHK